MFLNGILTIAIFIWNITQKQTMYIHTHTPILAHLRYGRNILIAIQDICTINNIMILIATGISECLEKAWCWGLFHCVVRSDMQKRKQHSKKTRRKTSSRKHTMEETGELQRIASRLQPVEMWSRKLMEPVSEWMVNDHLSQRSNNVA